MSSTSSSVISFNDIVGHNEEKSIIIETLLRPLLVTTDVVESSSPSTSRRQSRSLLLASPPGVGKTLILKALHEEANKLIKNASSSPSSSVHYKMINSMEIVVEASKSSHQSQSGSGEAIVKQLFQDAIDHQPSILCVDDIDCFFHSASSSSSSPTSAISEISKTILEYLNEIAVKQHRVLVACTSVSPSRLDLAAVHHFSRRLVLHLPNLEEKKIMLINEGIKKFVNSSSEAETVSSTLTSPSMEEGLEEYLSSSLLTSLSFRNCTGADLQCFLRDVLMEPVRDAVEEMKKSSKALTEDDVRKVIMKKDFENVIVRRKNQIASVTDEDVEEFSKFEREYGTGRNLDLGCTLHFR